MAEARRRIKGGLSDINLDVNIRGATRAKSDVDKVTKATRKAQKASADLGRTVAISLKRFATYSVATRLVGLLTTGLASAVSEAISFEREMLKISQVSGKTLQQLSGLSDEVTRLATEFGVASGSLLGVTRILTQAGLSAGETKTALEALAKSELAPTFDNITQTAEGAVAIFNQFKEGAGALEEQLGSINAVAGKFAVESGDLIAAVRRVGGVFKASGGSLEELLALFTSIRSTTRESGESIATGLRTIFVRLQRPRTLDFLKEMGVNLRDLEGKFVGPYEAIRRMNKEFGKFEGGDPRFIKVAEEIAGFRQIGKVIPLLQQFKVAQDALDVAKGGKDSLTKDALAAQASLAVRIVKVKQEFLALVREIYNSPVFQGMADSTIRFLSALIKVGDALKNIIPLLGVFASIKLAKTAVGFVGNIGKNLASPNGFSEGGGIGQKSGVPYGVAGSPDDTLIHAQTGEFVVKKSSASKLGLGALNYLNKHGEIPQFNQGGSVGMKKSEVIQKSFDRNEDSSVLSSLAEADSVMKDFLDSMKKWGAMFQGIAKEGIADISKSDPGLEGTAYPDGGIGVAIGRTNKFTVPHETAHQVDRRMGERSPGIDFESSQYASGQGGTFQNAITEKLKPILKKQLQKEKASADEISYRLENEEIFADLMAKTVPVARAILVHTTSAEKGLAQLAKLVERDGNIPGLAGLSSEKIAKVPRKKSFKKPSYFYAGGKVGNEKYDGSDPMFPARGRDTQRAMLAPGEFVVNNVGVGLLGPNFLSQANKGKKPTGPSPLYAFNGGYVSNGVSYLATGNESAKKDSFNFRGKRDRVGNRRDIKDEFDSVIKSFSGLNPVLAELSKTVLVFTRDLPSQGSGSSDPNTSAIYPRIPLGPKPTRPGGPKVVEPEREEEKEQTSSFGGILDGFSGKMVAAGIGFSAVTSVINGLVESGSELADKFNAIQEAVLKFGTTFAIYYQILKKAKEYEASQKADKEQKETEVKLKIEQEGYDNRQIDLKSILGNAIMERDDLINKAAQQDELAKQAVVKRDTAQGVKSGFVASRDVYQANVDSKKSEISDQEDSIKTVQDRIARKRAKISSNEEFSKNYSRSRQTQDRRTLANSGASRRAKEEASKRIGRVTKDNPKLERSIKADENIIKRKNALLAKEEKLLAQEQANVHAQARKITGVDRSIAGHESERISRQTKRNDYESQARKADYEVQRAENEIDPEDIQDSAQFSSRRRGDSLSRSERAKRAGSRTGFGGKSRFGRQLSRSPILNGFKGLGGAAKGLVSKMGGLSGVMGFAGAGIAALAQAVSAVADYMQTKFLAKAEKNLESGDYDSFRSNSTKAAQAGRVSGIAQGVGNGALIGSAAGAAIGSFTPVGPVGGATIGAVVGGIGGGLYAASGDNRDFAGEAGVETAIMEDALKKASESLVDFSKGVIDINDLLSQQNESALASDSAFFKKSKIEADERVSKVDDGRSTFQKVTDAIGTAVANVRDGFKAVFSGDFWSAIADSIKSGFRTVSDYVLGSLYEVGLYFASFVNDDSAEELEKIQQGRALVAKQKKQIAAQVTDEEERGFKTNLITDRGSKLQTLKAIEDNDKLNAAEKGDARNTLLQNTKSEFEQRKEDIAERADSDGNGKVDTIAEKAIEKKLLGIANEQYEDTISSLRASINAQDELTALRNQIVQAESASLAGTSRLNAASVTLENSMGMADGTLSSFAANLNTIEAAKTNTGLSGQANSAITENVNSGLKRFGIKKSDDSQLAKQVIKEAKFQQESNTLFDKVSQDFANLKVTGLGPDEKASDAASKFSAIVNAATGFDPESGKEDSTLGKQMKKLFRSNIIAEAGNAGGDVDPAKLEEARRKTMEQLQPLLKASTKTLEAFSAALQKLDAFKLQRLQKQIELENELVNVRLSGIDLNQEADKLIESAGGPKAKSDTDVAIQRQNLLNKEAGVAEISGPQDFSKNISEIENALNKAQSDVSSGKFDGDPSGLAEQQDTINDLNKAMQQQTSTIRDTVKAKQDELELIGRKNKLEKDSIDSLIKGDIADFFKKQSAVGATAAAASGDDRLIGLFGASAIGEALDDVQSQKGAGVTSLYGQDIGSLQENLRTFGLKMRGFDAEEARSAARSVGGNSPQEQRINAETRGLGGNLKQLSGAQNRVSRTAVRGGEEVTRRIGERFQDDVRKTLTTPETEAKIAAEQAAKEKAKEKSVPDSKPTPKQKADSDSVTSTTEGKTVPEAGVDPLDSVRDLSVQSQSVYLNGVSLASVTRSSPDVDSTKLSSSKFMGSLDRLASSSYESISNVVSPGLKFVDNGASSALDAYLNLVGSTNTPRQQAEAVSTATSTSTPVADGVPTGAATTESESSPSRSYFSEADVKNFNIFLEATQKLSAAVEKLASSQIHVKVDPMTVTLNVTGPDLLDYVSKAARNAVADEVRNQIAARNDSAF